MLFRDIVDAAVLVKKAKMSENFSLVLASSAFQKVN